MRNGILGKWFVVIICACGAVAFGGPARIIYVDAGAQGAKTGSSWVDACNSLQDALAAAVAADKPVEVRIARGLYKPDQGAGITPGDQTASFQLLNGVTLKGGYAGLAGPDPNARDVNLYETVLSGDLAGNGGTDMEIARDDSCRIILGRQVDNTAVMDGLTIAAPSWVEPSFDCLRLQQEGRARVVIDGGSPMIRDCQFVGDGHMGPDPMVLLSNDSAPTFVGCVFRASYSFKGIQSTASKPTLVNCLFTGNKFSSMVCSKSSMVSLTNCRFESGQTGIDGGDASVTLTDCTFVDNSMRAIHSSSSVVGATNCVFERNGSAVEMLSGALTLTDCRFEGNKTAVGSVSDMVAVRCAFTGNSGGLAGAISADS